MAGVAWRGSKMKKNKVKQNMLHCEKEERKNRSHKNENIDKTLTDNNISAYGLSYEEMIKKYDERIKPIELKTKQMYRQLGRSMRKDTVYCLCPIVYVPNELDEDESLQFTNHIFDYFKNKFGANYIEGILHTDEQHEYVNTNKEIVMSQKHIHNFIIPEIDGKLNAKKMVDRKLINEINKHIEDYCIQEFGIHYVKGTNTKSRKTVEELKAQSHELEIQLQKEKLEKEINELNNAIRNKGKEINRINNTINNKEKAYATLSDDYESLSHDYNLIENEYYSTQNNVDELENEKKQLEEAINQKNIELQQKNIELEEARKMNMLDTVKYNGYKNKKEKDELLRKLDEKDETIIDLDKKCRIYSNAVKEILPAVEKIEKAFNMPKGIKEIAQMLDDKTRTNPEQIELIKEHIAPLENIINITHELYKNDPIRTIEIPRNWDNEER